MRPTKPIARGREPQRPTIRIGDPLADGIGQPEPIVLPDPARLFARRAARLDLLAEGHPMADWLRFLAALVRVQDLARGAMPLLAPIPPAELERSVAGRAPPLAAAEHQRHPAWRAALRVILAHPDDAAPTREVEAVIAGLRSCDDAELEALADDCLQNAVRAGQAGAAIYAAAALQVYFVARAASLNTAALRLLPERRRCPVCGSAPVAGVITAAGRAPGTRYLHCGICGSAWNHMRAVCVSCGGSGALALHEIEGGDGVVKAETCGACRCYSKVVYEAGDSAVEPMAEDLASLGLDLLVNQAGWSRMTPNPFVVT